MKAREVEFARRTLCTEIQDTLDDVERNMEGVETILLADPFTSLYDLPDPLTGEPAPGFESICLQGTPAVVDTYKAALWIYLVFSLESTSASAVFLEGYLKRLRAKTGNLVG